VHGNFLVSQIRPMLKIFSPEQYHSLSLIPKYLKSADGLRINLTISKNKTDSFSDNADTGNIRFNPETRGSSL
jgi:hypothetical protein